MDIEALRTFLVLSQTKNYTRTASQLFVAQSTVTNRIAELERELNFPLFIRTNRSVSLTPQGEQFVDYASTVLKLTDSSLSEISSFQKYTNHLRIGCSDSIYDGHLADLILNFQRQRPDVSLKISIGLTSALVEQMNNDIFDVVFTYLPINKASLRCEIFKKDKMSLVTDINNKVYAKGITKAQLIQENYLMCNFALQEVGQFVRGLFPKYHQFSLEIDDCEKIIPFITGQNSYTFLPEDMAKQYINENILRSIPLIDLEPPVINSYIICKKQKWELCKEIFL